MFSSGQLNEETSLFANIIVKIGTIIGIGLNLSSIVLFYEVFRKKRLYTEIPESYIVSNVVNNIINLAWGFQKKDQNMQISSGAGTGIALTWGILYLFFVSQKKVLMFALYVFILLNLSTELCYIFGFMIQPQAVGDKVAGIVAFILTIVNNATPGQNIITVIKTGKYKLIPIVTTCFGLACGTCWFIYGIVELKDYMMYVPNGLGMLLNILQIVVYIPNYIKYRNKVWEDETPTTGGPDDHLVEGVENDPIVHEDNDQQEEP